MEDFSKLSIEEAISLLENECNLNLDFNETFNDNIIHRLNELIRKIKIIKSSITYC
jgi:hypothetical protein